MSTSVSSHACDNEVRQEKDALGGKKRLTLGVNSQGANLPERQSFPCAAQPVNLVGTLLDMSIDFLGVKLKVERKLRKALW